MSSASAGVKMKTPRTGISGGSGQRRTEFHPVSGSLSDLVGSEFVAAAIAAQRFMRGQACPELERLGSEVVDFYPSAFHERLVSLLPHVGTRCVSPLPASAHGATTAAIDANTKTGMAPQSCLGYYRLGENGHLSLISKAEHYHVVLGHTFPGYALLERAKQLGIPNSTHNNTRGHVTRLLEEELVRVAAGLPRTDGAHVSAVLTSREPRALNRVLNLETGSLAAEAALKLVLGRFYRPETVSDEPVYADRIPVLLVMGDDGGGIQANYHGTTMLTQVMRGMWPAMAKSFEENGVFLVRSVRPNAISELEEVFAAYDKAPYKIAGFFHELVLMNYAARRLSTEFVQRAYALCAEHDVPTIVDEIQTCVWSPEVLMFKEYGVKPSAVVLGKGFPGGEYAASRVLFDSTLDVLPQFGALVTNGQEELASLAYLITLRWAEANADVTGAVGDHYESRLRAMAGRYPALITSIEGRRHLAGIFFDALEPAHAFVKALQAGGLDISVQAYKDDCPPCALTKLPLTMGYEAVDFVVDRMEEALAGI